MNIINMTVLKTSSIPITSSVSEHIRRGEFKDYHKGKYFINVDNDLEFLYNSRTKDIFLCKLYRVYDTKAWYLMENI